MSGHEVTRKIDSLYSSANNRRGTKKEKENIELSLVPERWARHLRPER